MDREKMLENFANSIPDPVVITGLDHTILFVNRAAVELFKEDESLVGKSLFFCHNQESKQKMETVLEQLKNGEEEVQIPSRQGGSPDNRQHTFMRAIRNADGELVGYYERYMYWGKRID